MTDEHVENGTIPEVTGLTRTEQALGYALRDHPTDSTLCNLYAQGRSRPGKQAKTYGHYHTTFARNRHDLQMLVAAVLEYADTLPA